MSDNTTHLVLGVADRLMLNIDRADAARRLGVRAPIEKCTPWPDVARMAKWGAPHRHWYTSALPILAARAKFWGMTVADYCDILAICSPQTSVKNNFTLADAYCRQRIRLADEAPIDVAIAIGAMEGVAAGLLHWECTGEVRGPKTGPFSLALQGDGDALVLDTWMAKAFGIAQASLSRKECRAAVAGTMAMVASRLGWSVAETQAAVWAWAVLHIPNKRGRLRVTLPTVAESLAA